MRLLILHVLLLPAALALADTTPAKAPVETVTKETVEAKIKELDAAPDLDDESRAKIREKYQEALKALESADQWAGKSAAYQKMAESATDELAKTKAELAKVPEKPGPEKPGPVTTEGTVAELERAVSEKESALDAKKAELSDLAAEAKRRTSRRAEIPKLLADARRRLAETQKEIEAAKAAKEETPAAAARRIAAIANRQAVEQEILALEREPKAYEARLEVLPLRRDLAAKQTARLDAELAALRSALDRRRKSETEAQLRKARREASRAAPEVAAHLEENENLARERKDRAVKLEKTRHRWEQTEKTLTALQDQFKRTKEKVDAAGLTTAIGLLLRKQRDALPDVRAQRESVAKRQEEIREIRGELLELDDQRSELADLDGRVEKELDALGPEKRELDREELKKAIREALQTKKEYLDALIGDTNSYFDRLIELDMAQRRLIEETEAYQEYADERVLWIRSTLTIGVDDFRKTAAGARRLVDPIAWRNLLRDVGSEIWKNKLATAAAVLLLIIVLYAGRRTKRQLVLIGEKAARSTCCRALPTFEALLLTLFLSVILPGILWCLAWRASFVAGSTFWAAFSEGLFAAAKGLFGLMLIYHACRYLGLAEAHFGWPVTAIRSLRRYVRWSMILILPLAFVCVATQAAPGTTAADPIGRLSLTAAAVICSVFLAMALRFGGPLAVAIWNAYPSGRLRKTRHLWIPAVWLLPAALAVLAASGYYYTAQRLSECIVITGWLALALLFLRALLLRCILVRRRALAMEAARQRRAAMQTEEKPAGDGSIPSVVPTPVEPDLDLAAINIQARRLVEYSLLVAGAVGLWFIWVGVLPALGAFERVDVWRSLDDVRTVTLADVLLAVLIAMTAFSAAKNIPGLLEMTWLQRFELDHGLRYTIGMVSRYSITAVGVIVVCHVVGISWSKVQWLIAAVSVGLGFGLQEIFANFVSGLIILFERPVRVGDIVTVGDVTGVVSRIRMRATTITNWDRKEYVVPNKEFVTGRLLNWTLSDSVNRVVIEVGVAYGSDTQLARRLLLSVAAGHPLVLADPEPLVTFEAFGDSALTFVLRCYLPDLERRLETINDLHMEIDCRFREAGIEIAFPQRDIHVRSMPERLTAEDAAERKETHPPADDSGKTS